DQAAIPPHHGPSQTEWQVVDRPRTSLSSSRRIRDLREALRPSSHVSWRAKFVGGAIHHLVRDARILGYGVAEGKVPPLLSRSYMYSLNRANSSGSRSGIMPLILTRAALLLLSFMA